LTIPRWRTKCRIEEDRLMQTPLDVLEQARSFMISRAILTAAELDLFTRLDKQAATAGDLAPALQLDQRALTRLLDFLVTLGLFHKQGEAYRVTENGAHFSARHPTSALAMLQHLNMLWNNWSYLTATVRDGNNPGRRTVIGTASEDDARSFIGAMHAIARRVAADIAAACDALRFERLLDIGGGSGAYTIAFLQNNPHLHAVLFDLPNVVPMARQNIVGAGLEDRVTFMQGDFGTDELPGGCDLALLSAIIHQNGPEENIELYAKVHRALEPGGVLLIRDHIMDESRTKPPDGALFALNMLVNTAAGDTYTFAEVEKPLRQVGFSQVRLLRSGERMDCLVEATKASAA
jgi:SAM-dependent methyltransferase